MPHTPENQTQTTTTPNGTMNNFPPLPDGYELIRETAMLCNYCGNEYYVQYYVTPTKLVLSDRTACSCKAAEVEGKQYNHGIDVTTDLDMLFRNWNLLYTDKKEYFIGQCETENQEQEKIKNSIVGYLRQFKPGSKGICFYGSSGRGKTHLAMCISRSVKDKGYTVLAIKSIDLLNRLRKCYQSKEQDQEIEVMRVLKNVELLLIDDIGSEKVTGWVEEKLYEVIDTRHERLTTIFTTNLNGEEMSKKLGQAIASRIFGTGYQVHITGRDRRLTNTKLDFSDIGKEV